MHYLITGHTGFKGAWMVLFLHSLGHKVSGVSLDPIAESLFSRASLHEIVAHDYRIDIRDKKLLQKAVIDSSPDAVIHMAAQPLVRYGYENPFYTFETNVLGTLNVLEVVNQIPNVKSHTVVTTDKVYFNNGKVAGYSENDPLGGIDPYSASKTMADILATSWMNTYPLIPTAIVRGGNVIGGGDVSKDRLVPDLIASYSRHEAPVLRYPEAVRPWQHVLDCISGYLKVTDLLQNDPNKGKGAWNIGPTSGSAKSVASVAEAVAHSMDSEISWKKTLTDEPYESDLLLLDSTKATQSLDWRNKLNFQQSIDWTVEWYREAGSTDNVRELTLNQIDRFLNLS
jgi:CDP-glucose 4,6-dehydratase